MRRTQWVQCASPPGPHHCPRTTWAPTSPVPLQKELDRKVRGPEGATDWRLPMPWGTSDAGPGARAGARQAGSGVESKPSALPALGRRGDGHHLPGPACTGAGPAGSSGAGKGLAFPCLKSPLCTLCFYQGSSETSKERVTCSNPERSRAWPLTHTHHEKRSRWSPDPRCSDPSSGLCPSLAAAQRGIYLSSSSRRTGLYPIPM